VKQRFTFPKRHKLKHRKDIERVVSEGKSFNVYPLRVVVLNTAQEVGSPVRLAVAVPKRKFKKAVDRNLIKRRIREAFRLNSGEFVSGLALQGRSVHIMIIFTGNESATFHLIQSKIILILQRLHGIHTQDSLNDAGGPADVL